MVSGWPQHSFNPAGYQLKRRTSTPNGNAILAVIYAQHFWPKLTYKTTEFQRPQRIGKKYKCFKNQASQRWCDHVRLAIPPSIKTPVCNNCILQQCFLEFEDAYFHCTLCSGIYVHSILHVLLHELANGLECNVQRFNIPFALDSN